MAENDILIVATDNLNAQSSFKQTSVDPLLGYLAGSGGLSVTTNGAWNLNQAREEGACGGSVNSAWTAGGYNVGNTLTENFDGNTWTISGDLNNARIQFQGCGLLNSGLVTASLAPSTGWQHASEKYNGSIWSTDGAWDFLANREDFGICGNSTSAVLTGGDDLTNGKVDSYSFNGTTWSSIVGGDLNTARTCMSMIGSTSDGMVCGGFNKVNWQTAYDSTEIFNGATWSVGASLIVARAYPVTYGNTSLAFVLGGVDAHGNNSLQSTEFFNGVVWASDSYTLPTTNYLYMQASNSYPTGGVFSGGQDFDTGDRVATTYKISYSVIPPTNPSDKLIPTQKAVLDYIETAPEITDFTVAQHDHSDVINGGSLAQIEPFPALTTTIVDFTDEFGASYEQTTEDGIFFKATPQTINFDTWATDASMDSLSTEVSPISFGVTNAGVNAGGATSPVNTTEYFNGQIFRVGASMSANQYDAGCGTFYAGIASGIRNTLAEKFDGTSWSNSGGIPRDFQSGRCTGRQNANVISGFYGGGGGVMSHAQETYVFNGSAYQSNIPMNVPRIGTGMIGSVNNSLVISGGDNAGLAYTSNEYFNGLVWSYSIGLNNERINFTASGVYNAGIAISGYDYTPAYLTSCEKFNGYVWSYSAPVSVSATQTGSFGTTGSCIKTRGTDGGTSYATTEKYIGSIEFAIDSYLIGETYERKTSDTFFTEAEKTDVQLIANEKFSEDADMVELDLFDYVGFGVWTTDGGWDLNTAREYQSGNGIMNNAITIGGFNGGTLDSVETFDGLTWNSETDFPIEIRQHNSFGKTFSSISAGGFNISSTIINSTYSFNGSSWSSVIGGNLNTSKMTGGAFGIKNSAIYCGGDTTGGITTTPQDSTESFNSLVWSVESATLNVARLQFGYCGNRYSGLITLGGGSVGGPPTYTNSSDKWNGNSWSVVSTPILTNRQFLGMSGKENNSMIFGGHRNSVAYLTETEKWNGTYWYVGSSLNTGIKNNASAGFNNSALSFGGYDGSVSAVTEKYMQVNPTSVPVDFKYTTVAV